MKSSPDKQSGQPLNSLPNRKPYPEPKAIDRPTGTQRQAPSPLPLEQRSRRLKTKATFWAIAVSILPVLAVGGATYYLGSQSVSKQIEAIQQGKPANWADAEQDLQRQLALVLMGTGATAVVSGAIASILANRAVRPVVNAAAASTTVVNRLRHNRNDLAPPGPAKDEIDLLENNINFIKTHLPEMLWRQEAKTERSRVFLTVTRRIREARTEADVFKVAVEEIRTVLRIDRVAVFRFNSGWNGTFVEESAASGLPKMVWTTISDPWFEEASIQQYQNGRVQAIDNIYQAGLNDAYIGLLERFAVKAHLIAPILKDDELIGLLIGHQCSEPRSWDQAEIDLFAQLANQIGFALDYAHLLEQVDTRADQAQLFINITRRIRASLNEEDVLRTTVEEIRKALSADRVMVYSFDQDWYGTVIAESVVIGFPKALRAKIKDPCFVEGYVEKYQAGRVQATRDIYQAGFTSCHIKQLEPFAVKANLVAPILKDDKLFGLLIAHQCSGPRDWQKSEMDLFAQLAIQVGFALDHARLLTQFEQIYQAAEDASFEDRQQWEGLQRQVTQSLRDSQAVVQRLAANATNQAESITAIHRRMQALVDAAQQISASAQQAKHQDQQLSQTIQDGQALISRLLEGTSTIRQVVETATEKVKRLDQPSRKLSQVVTSMSKVASQTKLQAMNAALKSTASDTMGQDFAIMAEKVLSLSQQLDADIGIIRLLVTELQGGMDKAIADMETSVEQAIAGTQFSDEIQHSLQQLTDISTQMDGLIEEIAQASTVQMEISTVANQAVLEVATIASETSDQTASIVESLTRLSALTQG